ncbi:MAG: hypothetical protein CVV64_18075 [Candidatus Wallbacteria bacterium HGW-Wallbacteria-1]|uniref:Uncharacterized protein n=1 Tax=Candidatus Wallbacteria bacterium HGW-Wallbacteria-1 TaxID=2013854 RepID=A0A2N1PJT2_9BACT|nr:MAG: hypothetical protein CVV64_18075 [Candidatus Wallbacteria bacterium HGW-Wallbacteria-1]
MVSTPSETLSADDAVSETADETDAVADETDAVADETDAVADEVPDTGADADPAEGSAFSSLRPRILFHVLRAFSPTLLKKDSLPEELAGAMATSPVLESAKAISLTPGTAERAFEIVLRMPEVGMGPVSVRRPSSQTGSRSMPE